MKLTPKQQLDDLVKDIDFERSEQRMFNIEVAKETGISRQNIDKLFNRESGGNAITLIKIANVLGGTIKFIKDGKSNR